MNIPTYDDMLTWTLAELDAVLDTMTIALADTLDFKDPRRLQGVRASNAKSAILAEQKRQRALERRGKREASQEAMTHYHKPRPPKVPSLRSRRNAARSARRMIP